MGSSGGVVMEGRDIGTVVFPNAQVKIFLTASASERGRRRFLELAAKGDKSTLEEIIAQQQERDQRDSARAESPLRPADDAIIIESDPLSLQDVVSKILAICLDRSTTS